MIERAPSYPVIALLLFMGMLVYSGKACTQEFDFEPVDTLSAETVDRVVAAKRRGREDFGLLLKVRPLGMTASLFGGIMGEFVDLFLEAEFALAHNFGMAFGCKYLGPVHRNDYLNESVRIDLKQYVPRTSINGARLTGFHIGPYLKMKMNTLGLEFVPAGGVLIGYQCRFSRLVIGQNIGVGYTPYNHTYFIRENTPMDLRMAFMIGVAL